MKQNPYPWTDAALAQNCRGPTGDPGCLVTSPGSDAAAVQGMALWRNDANVCGWFHLGTISASFGPLSFSHTRTGAQLRTPFTCRDEVCEEAGVLLLDAKI